MQLWWLIKYSKITIKQCQPYVSCVAKTMHILACRGVYFRTQCSQKHPGGYNMQNIPYAKNIIFIKMTNYSKHEEYIAIPHMIRWRSIHNMWPQGINNNDLPSSWSVVLWSPNICIIYVCRMPRNWCTQLWWSKFFSHFFKFLITSLSHYPSKYGHSGTKCLLNLWHICSFVLMYLHMLPSSWELEQLV